MVKLSCFGSQEAGDEYDDHSNHSADSNAPPPSRLNNAGKRAQFALFPNKHVLTRPAAKQRLKKLLNVKKDQQDKERPVDDDPEYIILGKIYSELDATVDLASIARNRDTLSHLLPFLLNCLLYGFNDQYSSIASNHAGSGSGSAYQGSNSHNNFYYNRSGKKSSNLKVVRDPTQITLRGTSHLIKAQCEKQLEQFLYQQALNSVQFALECVWYLTTSLSMGPKESYHRTMTLLLGMESVVATSAPPGDLFKRAAVTETATPNVANTHDATNNLTNDTSPATNSTNTNNTSQSPTSTSTQTPTQTKGGKPGAVPDRIEENGGLNALTSKKTVREVDLDINGSGANDHRMQFNTPLKVGDEQKLQRWLDARKERSNVFHAQLDFVKCLTHISQELFQVEREFRRDVLRRELEKLNDHIPKNVSIPTDRRAHRILRIVPEAAHVFNTKERVPYLLVFEVEDLAPPPPGIDPVGGKANGHGGILGHDKREHNQSSSGHGGGDEEKEKSPLRRIGSLGHSAMGKNKPSTPTSSSTPASNSSNASKPREKSATVIENNNQQRSQSQQPQEGGTELKNQPENKFEFSPDVTAEVNSLAALKRESSFRFVDAQHADDRRPPDEELLKALGEGWSVKSERLKEASPFGTKPNWRLVSVIVKARDQLRQEMFAQRLIQEFSRIFEGAGIPLWLRAYQILSTSHDSGLIETVTDALSIDAIKKQQPRKVVTLQDYFSGRFGGRGTQGYKRAVKNFVHSMAGYSVVQYLLNIKDRHNGNLMIDAEGHLIHIDFGFLLSNSPGGNMEFEKSPFKLTNEMVQVMGGSNSGAFKLFKKLCVQGYLEASRYANKILLMVDIMYPGNESMPCFLQGREYVLENLRERFGVDLTKKERASRMLKLIQHAHGNWTTKAYDQFQKVSLGIAK